MPIKNWIAFVAAASEADARALVDVDPAVQNQTFACDVHPFHVFYAGRLQPPKRGA